MILIFGIGLFGNLPCQVLSFFRRRSFITLFSRQGQTSYYLIEDYTHNTSGCKLVSCSVVKSKYLPKTYTSHLKFKVLYLPYLISHFKTWLHSLLNFPKSYELSKSLGRYGSFTNAFKHPRSRKSDRQFNL